MNITYLSNLLIIGCNILLLYNLSIWLNSVNLNENQRKIIFASHFSWDIKQNTSGKNKLFSYLLNLTHFY